MKDLLGSVVVAFVCFGVSSCSLIRDQKAEASLAKVKSLIQVGDDIGDAKNTLTEAGFSVSEPYFSTILENEYWMDVYYGLQHTPFEQIGYGFDLPFPNVGKNQTIRGKIEADITGRIFNIY